MNEEKFLEYVKTAKHADRDKRFMGVRDMTNFILSEHLKGNAIDWATARDVYVIQLEDTSQDVQSNAVISIREIFDIMPEKDSTCMLTNLVHKMNETLYDVYSNCLKDILPKATPLQLDSVTHEIWLRLKLKNSKNKIFKKRTSLELDLTICFCDLLTTCFSEYSNNNFIPKLFTEQKQNLVNFFFQLLTTTSLSLSHRKKAASYIGSLSRWLDGEEINDLSETIFHKFKDIFIPSTESSSDGLPYLYGLEGLAQYAVSPFKIQDDLCVTLTNLVTTLSSTQEGDSYSLYSDTSSILYAGVETALLILCRLIDRLPREMVKYINEFSELASTVLMINPNNAEKPSNLRHSSVSSISEPFETDFTLDDDFEGVEYVAELDDSWRIRKAALKMMACLIEMESILAKNSVDIPVCSSGQSRLEILLPILVSCTSDTSLIVREEAFYWLRHFVKMLEPHISTLTNTILLEAIPKLFTLLTSESSDDIPEMNSSYLCQKTHELGISCLETTLLHVSVLSTFHIVERYLSRILYMLKNRKYPLEAKYLWIRLFDSYMATYSQSSSCKANEEPLVSMALEVLSTILQARYINENLENSRFILQTIRIMTNISKHILNILPEKFPQTLVNDIAYTFNTLLESLSVVDTELDMHTQNFFSSVFQAALKNGKDMSQFMKALDCFMQRMVRRPAWFGQTLIHLRDIILALLTSNTNDHSSLKDTLKHFLTKKYTKTVESTVAKKYPISDKLSLLDALQHHALIQDHYKPSNTTALLILSDLFKDSYMETCFVNELIWDLCFQILSKPSHYDAKSIPEAFTLTACCMERYTIPFETLVKIISNYVDCDKDLSNKLKPVEAELSNVLILFSQKLFSTYTIENITTLISYLQNIHSNDDSENKKEHTIQPNVIAPLLTTLISQLGHTEQKSQLETMMLKLEQNTLAEAPRAVVSECDVLVMTKLLAEDLPKSETIFYYFFEAFNVPSNTTTWSVVGITALCKQSPNVFIPLLIKSIIEKKEDKSNYYEQQNNNESLFLRSCCVLKDTFLYQSETTAKENSKLTIHDNSIYNILTFILRHNSCIDDNADFMPPFQITACVAKIISNYSSIAMKFFEDTIIQMEGENKQQFVVFNTDIVASIKSFCFSSVLKLLTLCSINTNLYLACRRSIYSFLRKLFSDPLPLGLTLDDLESVLTLKQLELDAQIHEELIRIIDFGPFKKREDHGYPLRLKVFKLLSEISKRISDNIFIKNSPSLHLRTCSGILNVRKHTVTQNRVKARLIELCTLGENDEKEIGEIVTQCKISLQ